MESLGPICKLRISCRRGWKRLPTPPFNSSPGIAVVDESGVKNPALVVVGLMIDASVFVVFVVFVYDVCVEVVDVESSACPFCKCRDRYLTLKAGADDESGC